MATKDRSVPSHPGEAGSPHGFLLKVQKKGRAFTLFRKVQKAMCYVPDFAQTCKAILDIVIDETDAENCSLMLKDPLSGELSVRAARGKKDRKSVYYSDHSGNGNGKRFKPGEGIAGKVLKEGQAVMLNDCKEEPCFVRAEGLNNRVRSLICFPVREKNQVVGVFNLSHSRKGAFDEGDKLALAHISNQVGAALTSARFFLEIDEMRRLKKDSRLNSPAGNLSSAPSYSTFIEVGEVTAENGIFIYASQNMHRIKEVISQIADTDATVLIQGESGVGKEVVARSMHLNSLRRDKPFVKVNCAALPHDLLESELFGYEKGAFTGAYRQKMGKFELADGGTIFLDEIGEISSALQAKLLQVLQDREFSRLGGKKDIHVDVRVLVATNRNIEDAVKEGRFREDLYYRLNVVNITVPPLRERREEIPIFVEYFLDKFQKKYGKKCKPLSEKAMKTFFNHPWTGNVRELENVLHRYVVLGDEETILEELLSTTGNGMTVQQTNGRSLRGRPRPSLKEVQQEAMLKAESEVIRKALERTSWNRKRASEILNISYKALLYKMKDYRIDKHLSASFSEN